MTTHRPRTVPVLLGTVLSLLLVLAPGAPAQESADADAAVEQDDIVRFTRAYAEVEAVREEYQEELGQTHSDDALADLREEMHERIREVLAEHEMTREEYDRIHFAVMTDPEARETFQQLLEELSARVEE